MLKMLDVMAPALALGLFFGRVGCFLNGCCYGRPTELPWGVLFPENSPAGYFQQHQLGALATIHPTQLYSSLYGLLIFALLIYAEKNIKKHEGFTTYLFFMLYPAARFTVEFFRHFYDQYGVVKGLTHNQYLAMIMFSIGLSGMVYIYQKGQFSVASPARTKDD